MFVIRSSPNRSGTDAARAGSNGSRMAPQPNDRSRSRPPLCIVLRPSARDRDLPLAVRCLKRLVPRAQLVIAPSAPPPDCGAEIVVLDASEISAGPLAAATALDRERRRARPTRTPS